MQYTQFLPLLLGFPLGLIAGAAWIEKSLLLFIGCVCQLVGIVIVFQSV